MDIVISMTSWKKRIVNVRKVLESLVDQNMKADFIELNLSVEEFPMKENDLPCDLVEFVKSHNEIEINWVNGNDGVFKKIIPTLKKFYGKEYYLLSVDDDWIYRSDYIELMVGYIEKYDADTFCLANANVIGNRQIYKSSCFREDFWKRLTNEVISTRIDDSYIEYYLKCHKKKMSHYRPSDTPDITKKFNPIYPNSNNEKTGQYSYKDIKTANDVISRVNFY